MADVAGPGLRVLICGINPGLYSAASGCHFAGPGNLFPRPVAAALESGQGRNLQPELLQLLGAHAVLQPAEAAVDGERVPGAAAFVAEERAVGVQVGDVVRRVARRVRDAEALDSLSTLEHVHVLLGDRRDLAPQRVHLVAVELAGAGEQLRGVDQVPGTALVHVHGQVRETADQHAARARVIEVDMRQEQGGDVADENSGPRELFTKARQRARRTRIDEGDAGRVVKDRCRNDFREAQKVQVDVIKSGGERQHGYRPSYIGAGWPGRPAYLRRGPSC